MGLNKGMQLKADMMLVLVTMCWGISYFMMDICLECMDPLTLNAYRFLGAFVIAAIISFNKIKNVSYETLKYALFISVSLVFVYIGATYGVKYTTQSNAGFFCATSTIFTPIMAFVINKVVPEKKLALAVVVCTVGIALMSFNEHFRINIGDLLCLLCGFSYGIDLIITEAAVKNDKVNPYQLGVYQLGFTGVWMLILSVLFENPCLPAGSKAWICVIFLSVFCTGVAFVVQAVAQQYTSATHVGVIFALEPVFAGVVAFAFAGERMLPRGYVGAVLMLLSILIMEVDIKGLVKNKIK